MIATVPAGGAAILLETPRAEIDHGGEAAQRSVALAAAQFQPDAAAQIGEQAGLLPEAVLADASVARSPRKVRRSIARASPFTPTTPRSSTVVLRIYSA